MAAMAVKQHDVKVKFIETQFISSDAASFKSVVQRLTGKHSTSPAPSSHSHTSQQPQPQPQPQRPRPCRPALFADVGASQQQQGAAGGWANERYSGNDADGRHHRLPAPKQEPLPALRVEDLYELCDFSDLLYAAAGTRRDGGFPY